MAGLSPPEETVTGTSSYTITAHNLATGSENRIHADDVARRYGFRGGLVPGVTVYGYVATGLAGPDWVARGRAEVRFRKPCYEGDPLEIDLGPDGAIEVRSRGEVCVTGRASVGAGNRGPAVASHDLAPAPSGRPLAAESSLAKGTSLGRIPLPTGEEALTSYLEKIGAGDWALDALHPGMLLEGANWVLAANVVLPPWIHVESSIVHRRAVRVGEAVEVHAAVAEEWERKGHRFVALDVAWRSPVDVVAAGRHVAIWRLAGSA
jgi:acyl dehydratase